MAALDAQEADLHCLLRVYDGDIRALGELFDRHTPLMHAVCATILASDTAADEVVHRTWLQVWRRTRTYARHHGPVANWLLALARRDALEVLRARGAGQEAAGLVRESGAPASARAGGGTPESRTVQRLPSLERQALQGAFFQGLDGSRLAAHLEVEPPVAAMLLRRGLHALAESAVTEVRV